MIDFIIQNKGTIIVLIILILSVSLAIIKMKKKKGCPGGCDGCNAYNCPHNKDNRNK